MEAKILSRQIENAQKKVEEQNFVSRKNVLKYDDVMNKQRVVIYEQRRNVLEGADLSEEVTSWIDEVVERAVDGVRRPGDGRPRPRRADRPHAAALRRRDHAGRAARGRDHRPRRARRGVRPGRARRVRGARRRSSGPDLMRELERFVILQVVDTRWREHLENMDYLREGVHLRAMAQKDPLVEYTSEGHAMFQELNGQIREEVLALLFHAQLAPEDAEELRRAPGGARRWPRTAAACRTSTSRSPAPTRSPPPAGRADGEGGRLDGDAAAAAGGRRAREARPQRPVLVRVGQEVQEVPRRVGSCC